MEGKELSRFEELNAATTFRYVTKIVLCAILSYHSMIAVRIFSNF